MDGIKRYLAGDGSSNPNRNTPIVPKPEMFNFELPSETMYSTRQSGDNNPSSSASNLRSSFIGMGFSPTLVDKVIGENGQANAEKLLEILIECADCQKAHSPSSDSLDSLFEDREASTLPDCFRFVEPKEQAQNEHLDVFGMLKEPILDKLNDDQRHSLLKMNFSANEVDLAMTKLGEHAPIGEIVDFIFAAQVAEKLEKEIDGMLNGGAEIHEDTNNETLFGTMEKTLRLLEMGFCENEVSLAIERLGSEVPVTDLAESICAGQHGEIFMPKKYPSEPEKFNMNLPSASQDSRYMGMKIENDPRYPLYGLAKMKTEDLNLDATYRSRNMNMAEKLKRKALKEDFNNHTDAQFRHFDFEDDYKGKRPKYDYNENFSFEFEHSWAEEKVFPEIPRTGMPGLFKPNSCRSLDRMVAKPPYFFYGNFVSLPVETWRKISQFLYSISPEFVDTQFFSAMTREEGYVHNLPTENRFHLLPKPPMTLKDAIPGFGNWWPSWDTRKKLSSNSFEINGVSFLCDKLGRMLNHSQGSLSFEQKKDILCHCQALNLVWVGPNKLGPIEAEYLELILGYPVNHTQDAGISLVDRFQLLTYCFQTDTLGYHLSVLKSMFPEGITMLSLFSGIGGAEVALHRLSIHLKGVVSVESSQTKQRILKSWWHNSGQTGQLEQIEDIQKLTSSKIERLYDKFGGFDLVMCQNSCTHPLWGPNHGETSPAFDFSLFCEFVRVLQCVRRMVERKR